MLSCGLGNNFALSDKQITESIPSLQIYQK